MGKEEIEIEDGCWDFYSDLPNPNWYNTFSDTTEDED